MSREPRAFATVDAGTATVAVSLIGRVEGRWRLLGSTAAPAVVGADALAERLGARLSASDPALAAACGLDAPGAAVDVPRVASRTSDPPVLVVAAATERVGAPLAAAAVAAGWRVRRATLAGADILRVATSLADPHASAVLAGTSDPPGADERPLLAELTSLIVAAVQRRPELTLILAGSLADPGGSLTEPARAIEAGIPADRPGSTLLAPSIAAAHGARTRDLLDGLRAGERDGRRALAASVATLAEVLGRRVELDEIGQSGGARVAADSTPVGPVPEAVTAIIADAALVPPEPNDSSLDAAVGWLTLPLDRLRVRDRLGELAAAPWGDAAGEGAVLRMAAARAALGRLVAATPAIDALPAPDLVVAGGGVWAVAPAPVVALALAEVIRRPGVRALGLDHARLLGPLGTIEDPRERRDVIADLRDDLLVPLGSVLMPAGVRPGRTVGRLAVATDGPLVELELQGGELELVDLPPGRRAVIDLRFRDPVDLGVRARRFGVEVLGGLGGLLVDLRDIPLRLPPRLEARREVLAGWQAALWPGLGS